MELGNLRLGTIKLPGPAGDLQRQGATAALIKELGDNYETYHAFLADRFVKIGGRPNAANYKTYEEYATAVSAAEDVVRAEIALRACRGFRRSGKRLDELPTSPLLDSADRLVAG
jgi:hypothetical protein